MLNAAKARAWRACDFADLMNDQPSFSTVEVYDLKTCISLNRAYSKHAQVHVPDAP